VDARYDVQNCGACGRTCKEKLDPIFEGGCFDGECRAMYSPCVTVEDGLLTCDAVCAAQGEACLSDTPPCSTVMIGWAEGDMAFCEGHFQNQGASFGSLHCSDPLPFGGNCDFPEICESFVCCCSQATQEP
jgi:hypothetical protein